MKHIASFRPRFFEVFRGYSRQTFSADLMAGLRAPMALRLMHTGKMNPLDSHPVNPEIDTIRKIVKNAEAAAKEGE